MSDASTESVMINWNKKIELVSFSSMPERPSGPQDLIHGSILARWYKPVERPVVRGYWNLRDIVVLTKCSQ